MKLLSLRISCPLVAAGRWSEIRDFIALTRSNHNEIGAMAKKNKRRWRKEQIRYGQHEMQHIDLFWPNADMGTEKYMRGTIVFVHGGAWGSGKPWMYRLVAPYFLRHGFVVAIVGYRTYPCVVTVTHDLDSARSTEGDSQLCDVRSAWKALQDTMGKVMSENKSRREWVGNVLMGHSSGAHLAAVMLVDFIDEQLNAAVNTKLPPKNVQPDYFIGLSGPYNISNHFDFEARRGVEQISPMKSICGGSRDNFSIASPVSRMLNTLILEKSNIDLLNVQCLFVHGIEDTTVPFTATADAARSLRGCGLVNCVEIYLENCGHQDLVMHLMLGGAAREFIMEYLLSLGRRKVGINSRL
jgi:pimeloyl-ACP methyl ester carboxylesterase